MYVCMYVCMHVSIQNICCIHVDMADMHECVCMHVGRHVQAYACMFPHKYVNRHEDKHTWISRYIYVYICMHIYMSADRHVCTYVWRQTSMNICVYKSYMSLHICLYIARHARVYAFVSACIWTHCNQQCDIHFPLLAYAPAQNMPATLHIFVYNVPAKCPHYYLMYKHINLVIRYISGVRFSAGSILKDESERS